MGNEITIDDLKDELKIEYSVQFSDYKLNPKELGGKYVIYESGTSFSGVNRTLCRVSFVLTRQFKISGSDKRFSLIDGHDTSVKGRAMMGTISRCSLVTPQSAHNMLVNKAKKEKLRLMKKEIVDTLDSLTYEQVDSIYKIITFHIKKD